jgi:hypothetical protein
MTEVAQDGRIVATIQDVIITRSDYVFFGDIVLTSKELHLVYRHSGINLSRASDLSVGLKLLGGLVPSIAAEAIDESAKALPNKYHTAAVTMARRSRALDWGAPLGTWPQMGVFGTTQVKVASTDSRGGPLMTAGKFTAYIPASKLDERDKVIAKLRAWSDETLPIIEAHPRDLPSPKQVIEGLVKGHVEEIEPYDPDLSKDEAWISAFCTALPKMNGPDTEFVGYRIPLSVDEAVKSTMDNLKRFISIVNALKEHLPTVFANIKPFIRQELDASKAEPKPPVAGIVISAICFLLICFLMVPLVNAWQTGRTDAVLGIVLACLFISVYPIMTQYFVWEKRRNNRIMTEWRESNQI